MRTLIRGFMLALLASFFALGTAWAQDRGNADQAKALLQKGLAHIKAVGTAKAFEDFNANDGKWTTKDLYIVVLKFNGEVAAHGTNKALIGKNMMEVKDVNGTFFTRETIEGAKTKGSGSNDYMFSNPVTKKVEPKTMYYERIPGFDGSIGVGIYKP